MKTPYGEVVAAVYRGDGVEWRYTQTAPDDYALVCTVHGVASEEDGLLITLAQTCEVCEARQRQALKGLRYQMRHAAA